MFPAKTNHYFSENAEFLVTIAFMLLCLVFFIFFPSQGSFQGLSKGLFFLVIIPSLYIKFVLQKTPGDFGFSLKNDSTGFIWSFFLLLASLAIFYLALNYTNFKNIYGLPEYLVSNFWLFLAYELILANFLLFIYFYFFQGFMLFYLSARFSYWAIPIQAVFFVLFFLIINNFRWQSFPVLAVFSIGLITTYKTKSFLYAYASGMLAILALDSYLVYTLK